MAPTRVIPKIKHGGRRKGAGRKPGKSRRKLTERINFRASPGLLGELNRAAGKHPLAVEITARLEASLEADRAEKRPDRLTGLLALVEELWGRLERKTGKAWNEDADTLERLCAGLPLLLRALAKPVTAITPDQEQEARRQGELDASELASAIRALATLHPDLIKGLKSVKTGRSLKQDLGGQTEHPLYNILYLLNEENL
jgi:hypothetical protein